jgi:hypothetical protein
MHGTHTEQSRAGAAPEEIKTAYSTSMSNSTDTIIEKHK